MTQHIALYGKVGVGKTTLATNITAALVEAGFTVVLVGCDLDGDSCSMLHVRKQHYLRYKSKLFDISFDLP